MRVINLVDGQPIKVLTDLFAVSTVYHKGFLVEQSSSNYDRDIELYLTRCQWDNNVMQIASKYQVGIFDEKESKIHFYDSCGVKDFQINEDYLDVLDPYLFELCSRFEFKLWLESNISEDKMPFDFADDFTFKKRINIQEDE